jgi:hypothetical protein
LKKTKTTSKFPKALPEYEAHSLIYDMPSEIYHSISGTFSSSQLKDMLDDEVTFKKKYIEKSIEREDVPAFAVGNYFHTGVLEPHKLNQDMAVFNGKVRRGSEWDSFKSKHVGKTIVTSSQVDEANRLIALVRDSEVAMSFVNRGKPEVSLFVELYVYGDDIYAPVYGKRLHRDFGWIEEKAPSGDPVKLVVKVRADSLGDDFVLDLKSTTGNARSERAMRTKISYYEYGLSASFYLDIFSLERGKQIEDFIWTFASKDMANCMSWKASEDNKKIGRVKWMRAVVRLANCIRTNWEIPDLLGVLEPEFYQLEYLKERDIDLL